MLYPRCVLERILCQKLIYIDVERTECSKATAHIGNEHLEDEGKKKSKI
jgi:hypothetical protein